MLEHLGSDHPVKARIRERQLVRGPPQRDSGRAGGQLARLRHGGEHLDDSFQLDHVSVERDGAGPSPGALEGMPAGAATKVEDDHFGPEPEPLEVDRQHRAAWRGSQPALVAALARSSRRTLY